MLLAKAEALRREAVQAIEVARVQGAALRAKAIQAEVAAEVQVLLLDLQAAAQVQEAVEVKDKLI